MGKVHAVNRVAAAAACCIPTQSRSDGAVSGGNTQGSKARRQGSRASLPPDACFLTTPPSACYLEVLGLRPRHSPTSAWTFCKVKWAQFGEGCSKCTRKTMASASRMARDTAQHRKHGLMLVVGYQPRGPYPHICMCGARVLPRRQAVTATLSPGKRNKGPEGGETHNTHTRRGLADRQRGVVTAGRS